MLLLMMGVIHWFLAPPLPLPFPLPQMLLTHFPYCLSLQEGPSAVVCIHYHVSASGAVCQMMIAEVNLGTNTDAKICLATAVLWGDLWESQGAA